MNRSTPLRVIALLIVLSASIVQAQTQIKPGFNLFSTQDDVQIGRQSATEAEKQVPLLGDATVTRYVSAIGQRLAKNAGGPSFTYQFRVVNATDINAFALPGGFVYVNRGVLSSARNEGEVAGVIAHEIAHTSLRHGTYQASKAYMAQLGVAMFGAILGGRVSKGAVDMIGQVGGVGLNVLFLKYSRDLETQADIRGAQILAATGYSPRDMVSFFETLEKVDPSKKTSFLADHPAPPDRIRRIEQESALLRVPPNPVENVAQLRQIQTRLTRIAAAVPTAPQQPAAAGTTEPANRVPAPSSTLKTYVSPSRVFSIAYPANWQVYPQNDSAVVLAPEGGAGKLNGQDVIVYGVIVNRYTRSTGALRESLQTPSRGAGQALEETTDELITRILRENSYLRMVSASPRRFTLSGADALAVTLAGNDPNTRTNERITVVTRLLAAGSPFASGEPDLIYAMFVTPERDAADYQRLFEAMLNSMRVGNVERD